MITVLIVFASMAIQDTFNALYTRSITNHHPWRAGAFDGTHDEFQYVAVGTAVLAARHGLSIHVVAVGVALFLGSVIGTVIGDKVETWLDRRLKRTLPLPRVK